VRLAAPALATENPPASVPLPPIEFVTVTSRDPRAAPAAIVSVAVSWVEDATARFETVMPEPKLTVEPLPNPVPVMVAATCAPGVP
jgi:hypothetical protein